MFQDSSGELVTKTIKDNDGISIELKYYLKLNATEISKLKEFRENYAKTSSIHFNFDEEIFLFNKKYYFKKKQFIKDPPKLDEIESNFLDEIKFTLNRYKNFLHFDQLENLEKKSEINLNVVLQRV
jgi:tRNA splicing endonuclease